MYINWPKIFIYAGEPEAQSMKMTSETKTSQLMVYLVLSQILQCRPIVQALYTYTTAQAGSERESIITGKVFE